MNDFPKNLLEFEDRFATEADCLAYVKAKKWPHGFRCAKCGFDRSWPVRQLEECAACGHQESVTAGTLFHQTRKPLRLWFRAITLWVTSKRSFSAKELSRQLGVHYETAWHWCHRLRACVAASYGQEPLQGEVEVDATYLGGSGDRAQQEFTLANHKALVAGAVEVRGASMGRARLARLTDTTSESRRGFVTRNVESRAAVGHQRGVVKARPRLNRLFSLLTRVVLGTFHGSISHKHLPAYLKEFEFRFNRRNSASRWLLFERVLSAARGFLPPTMAQLTRRQVVT